MGLAEVEKMPCLMLLGGAAVSGHLFLPETRPRAGAFQFAPALARAG